MTDDCKGETARRRNAIPATLRRRQRGAGLVEQAIVLTLFLTVLFAIIDFGRALYTYHFVSNAAREASRWASVRGFTCTGLSGGCPAGDPDVQTYVSNVSGMGLDPTKITATTSWPITSFSSPTCGTQINNPGCVVQVQVTYSYNFFFPFLPTSPITMQSTSQMVISQ
jgi:Flp pilus assembly protein TadG